jgi:spore coat protein U-like protein
MKSSVILKSRATAAAVALAAIAAASTSSLPAWAASSTGTVNVSAAVDPQCNVLTKSLTMGFGTVDVLATGSAASNPSLRVQCNKGATVGVTANNGLNAVGAQKRMKNTSNADMLAYSILQATGGSFSTCPATIAAGAELAATSMDVSSLWGKTGGPRDITLCGLLETPQADASPGKYADTVVVTVTY